MQGVLDAAAVTQLGLVPKYWTPNAARAPLPAQLPKIDIPLTAVSATATSGDAALAVDGLNDSSKGPFGETLWTSTGTLPQSVTIDLGQVYDGIDMLEYLPQRWTGTTNGNITSYTIYASSDGTTFTKVTSGTWPASPDYNNLLSPQRVQFTATNARYWKLEADAVAGGGTEAIIGEVAVGSSEPRPNRVARPRSRAGPPPATWVTTEAPLTRLAKPRPESSMGSAANKPVDPEHSTEIPYARVPLRSAPLFTIPAETLKVSIPQPLELVRELTLP